MAKKELMTQLMTQKLFTWGSFHRYVSFWRLFRWIFH